MFVLIHLIDCFGISFDYSVSLCVSYWKLFLYCFTAEMLI